MLLANNQASHVGANRRMETEIICQQSNCQCSQQDGQRRVLSLIEGQVGLQAQVLQPRHTLQPFRVAAREYPHANKRYDDEEQHSLARRCHSAEQCKCFFAGGERYHDGDHDERADVVKHRRRHNAQRNNRVLQTEALQRHHG